MSEKIEKKKSERYMNIEYEIRVLEIDVEEIKAKLEKLKAKKVDEMEYKRYVYYTKEKIYTKWIRLRTDGKVSTITYKNIKEKTVDGTEELEIEVDNFEKSKEMIEKLGFEFRGYQENKRIRYILEGVEIDIDFWPMIPPYLEIEGKNEEEIMKIAQLLGVDNSKITTLNCGHIYKEIYGIDIDKIKKISFGNIEYK